jgi:hypothetical protein
MSSYYDDEDELDIRVRRGRISPNPTGYPEHRYRPSTRPYYGHENSYLVPAVSAGLHRSRSTGHAVHRRPSPPLAAPAPPVQIINNYYDDDDYLPVAPPRRDRSHSRSHSHSRSRPNSFVATRDPRDEYELEKARRELEQFRAAHNRDEQEIEKTRRDLEAYRMVHTRDEYEVEKTRRELEIYRIEKEKLKEESRIKKQISQTKEDLELEKTKKELQAYKAEKERAAEEARIKQEMEFARLREEKKAAEEKDRLKKESDKAVEIYKAEQAEKAAKAKKEKEEREKEYQARLEEDLRKSGMDERQISVVLKKDKGVDPNRPTYTRMSRRHLSIETLNKYRIDYEFDQVRIC